MAIALYCFTVVVPLSSIERGYPGGLLAWIEYNREYIGKRIWFDDKLAGTTYYDPEQSYDGLCEWVEMGFVSQLGNTPLDSALLCTQADPQIGILGSDVDWLEFDSEIPGVWLKGSDPGRTAGPEHILKKIVEDRESDKRAVEEWLKKWGDGGSEVGGEDNSV